MLYIDVEVNGHMVKAFVDSGAQRTISKPNNEAYGSIIVSADCQYLPIALKRAGRYTHVIYVLPA